MGLFCCFRKEDGDEQCVVANTEVLREDGTLDRSHFVRPDALTLDPLGRTEPLPSPSLLGTEEMFPDQKDGFARPSIASSTLSPVELGSPYEPSLMNWSWSGLETGYLKYKKVPSLNNPSSPLQTTNLGLPATSPASLHTSHLQPSSSTSQLKDSFSHSGNPPPLPTTDSPALHLSTEDKANTDANPSSSLIFQTLQSPIVLPHTQEENRKNSSCSTPTNRSPTVQFSNADSNNANSSCLLLNQNSPSFIVLPHTHEKDQMISSYSTPICRSSSLHSCNEDYAANDAKSSSCLFLSQASPSPMVLPHARKTPTNPSPAVHFSNEDDANDDADAGSSSCLLVSQSSPNRRVIPNHLGDKDDEDLSRSTSSSAVNSSLDFSFPLNDSKYASLPPTPLSSKAAYSPVTKVGLTRRPWNCSVKSEED